MILFDIGVDFTEDAKRDEFVSVLLFEKFVKFFDCEIFVIEWFLFRSRFF